MNQVDEFSEFRYDLIIDHYQKGYSNTALSLYGYLNNSEKIGFAKYLYLLLNNTCFDHLCRLYHRIINLHAYPVISINTI